MGRPDPPQKVVDPAPRDCVWAEAGGRANLNRMPACPVCETENPGNAVECAGCGKVLRNAASIPGFAPPIEGLEPTLQEAAQTDVEPLPGLELTAVGSRDVEIAEEHLPVERTPHASNGAPVNWVPGELDLESGREIDVGPRTPRNAAPSDADAPKSTETILCPACLARVFPGIRCVECGVPLPPRDR
jgi:hypothetical protein